MPNLPGVASIQATWQLHTLLATLAWRLKQLARPHKALSPAPQTDPTTMHGAGLAQPAGRDQQQAQQALRSTLGEAGFIVGEIGSARCPSTPRLGLKVQGMVQDSPNPRGVMSSKASGEPALLLSTAVLHALRQATWAARAQLQPSAADPAAEPPCLEAPATPPRIRWVRCAAVLCCAMLLEGLLQLRGLGVAVPYGRLAGGPVTGACWNVAGWEGETAGWLGHSMCWDDALTIQMSPGSTSWGVTRSDCPDAISTCSVWLCMLKHECPEARVALYTTTASRDHTYYPNPSLSTRSLPMQLDLSLVADVAHHCSSPLCQHASCCHLCSLQSILLVGHASSAHSGYQGLMKNGHGLQVLCF